MTGRERLDARAVEQPQGLLADPSRLLLSHEIRLGYGDHGTAQPEKTRDVDVLDGLRLDPLVGGDHQQHGVDAGSARDHGAHETLVARHVDQVDVRIRSDP